MKKALISSFITLLAVLLLCACSSLSDIGMPELPKPTEEPEEVTGIIETGLLPPEETEAPEEPEPEAQPDKHIIVSIEAGRNETVYDPNNQDGVDNIILTFLSEKPIVMIENNNAAAEKINDFFNSMEEEISTGDSFGAGIALYPGYEALLNAAYDNYQVHIDYRLENRLDFAFSHTVDVLRCDSRVISFVFTDYLYKCEGTGTYSKSAVSFSSETGELLKVEKLGSADKIKQLINSEIEALSEKSEAYKTILEGDDYAVALEQLSLPGSWYVVDDGVNVVAANPVDSSTESAVLEMHIPFIYFDDSVAEQLKPAVNENKGELSVSVLSAENSEGINIVDSIKVDGEGKAYAVSVSGSVSNIKVSQVQYSDSDGQFYQKHVKWFSNYLTDCVLQLNALIPEGVPNLMISYSSGTESYSYLLSTDGIEGNPHLINQKDIEILG